MSLVVFQVVTTWNTFYLFWLLWGVGAGALSRALRLVWLIWWPCPHAPAFPFLWSYKRLQLAIDKYELVCERSFRHEDVVQLINDDGEVLREF